jgi:hypothetical protein
MSVDSSEDPELLAAAILATLDGFHHDDFAGRIDELMETVRSRWSGGFDASNFQDALDVLRRVGGASRSEQFNSAFVRVDRRGALGNLRARANPRFDPKKALPSLWEFGQFGEEWLKSVWSVGDTGVLTEQQASTEAAETAHVDIEANSHHNSSLWTGLPGDFVLNQGKQQELVSLLRAAESELDTLTIANSDKAQARAYILAARELSEAPDPPVDLIWEIIGRGNSIAGIASLFVAIIALFGS